MDNQGSISTRPPLLEPPNLCNISIVLKKKSWFLQNKIRFYSFR